MSKNENVEQQKGTEQLVLKQTLSIDPELHATIAKYLAASTPEEQNALPGINDMMEFPVSFPDGYKVVLRYCEPHPATNDLAYVEGCLYDTEGQEVDSTEFRGELLGEWTLSCGYTDYCVNVVLAE